MKKFASIAAVVAALMLAPAGAAQAQAPDWDQVIRTPRPAAQKKAAQKRKVWRSAPTRIVVRPTFRSRPDATEFPRTDNLGFPGRNAVRQCVSWLATEHRPSGTVVVPRMRCWWERG